ncbi:MAG: DUF167 domain-containing protein [Planctomycetota bacterium]
MSPVTPHPEGAVLRVRVSPGARRDRVLGLHGGALKIAVRSPADRGRANRELLATLARLFGTASPELLRGETARDKQVLFRGVDEAHLRSVLATVCDAP